jgi:hypothetical protein
LKDGENIFGF